MIGRQDHNGPRGNGINEDIAFTLTATDVSGVAAPEPYQEVIGALCNGDHKGVGNQYVSQGKCIVTKYLVRRLTPTECERLQGYPDGWTLLGHDGKEISDTRRYQMLGNSVAVNVVAYIMQGIAEQFNKTGEEVSGERMRVIVTEQNPSLAFSGCYGICIRTQGFILLFHRRGNRHPGIFPYKRAHWHKRGSVGDDCTDAAVLFYRHVRKGRTTRRDCA
jgi:hypothetical protein